MKNNPNNIQQPYYNYDQYLRQPFYPQKPCYCPGVNPAAENYYRNPQQNHIEQPHRRAKMIPTWFRFVKNRKNIWSKILLHTLITPVLLLIYGLYWEIKIVFFIALIIFGINLFRN